MLAEEPVPRKGELSPKASAQKTGGRREKDACAAPPAAAAPSAHSEQRQDGPLRPASSGTPWARLRRCLEPGEVEAALEASNAAARAQVNPWLVDTESLFWCMFLLAAPVHVVPVQGKQDTMLPLKA